MHHQMNYAEKDYLNFAETKSEKPKNVATSPSIHSCIPAPSSRLPRLLAMVQTRARESIRTKDGLVERTNDSKRQAVRSLGPLRSPVTRRPRVVYLPGTLPGILTATTAAVGRLISGAASRLDAVSAYPFPT